MVAPVGAGLGPPAFGAMATRRGGEPQDSPPRGVGSSHPPAASQSLKGGRGKGPVHAKGRGASRYHRGPMTTGLADPRGCACAWQYHARPRGLASLVASTDTTTRTTTPTIRQVNTHEHEVDTRGSHPFDRTPFQLGEIGELNADRHTLNTRVCNKSVN